mgnify:CR=1 FL=1
MYDNMVLFFSKNGKHSNFGWTTSAIDIVLLIFFAYFTFISIMFNIPGFLRFGACNFYHMQRIVSTIVQSDECALPHF